MATCSVNGTELYYELAGAGMPALFIHGMCGNANVWDGQVKLLSDRFQCVTYDRRGHTRSPLGDVSQRTVELHADDAAALLQRLDQSLLLNLPVLPFDAAAARRYGQVRADLERRGTPVGDADLRIASIALARGLTVVTGNVRHFQLVPGLTVENWLE